MFTRFVTATAIVLVSGGLAFAQSSGSGTDTETTAAGSAPGFQWNQTSQDAFFTDGTLRSDTDVRAAFDALDSDQQDQLRAECETMAGAGTGSDAASGGSNGSAASGSAGDTSGGAAAGSDTTGAGAAGGTTGSASDGSAATDSGGAAGGASAPDAASMTQLCAQVQSY